MQNKHKRFKLLSVMLVLLLSFALVFTTACGDNDDDNSSSSSSSSSVTEEEKVVLPIVNGHFTDMYTANSFPVNPRNWSLAADTIGSSSSSTSDVTQHGVVNMTDDEFYKVSDNFVTESMGSDLKFSDAEDSKLKNPFTPFMTRTDSDDATVENTDPYVLMLMNKTAAAGKYNSSSISFAQNQYARIIVYVNAFAVDENGKTNFADGQGASIAIRGGDAPVVLRNIDTSDYATTVEEIAAWTNRDVAEVSAEEAAKLQGWKRYEFLIEGSALSSSALTVELGLGKGAETDTTGYTEGFAFYDQVTMEYLTQKEYYDAVEFLDEDCVFATQTVESINNKEQAPQEHGYNFFTADKNATVFAYSFHDQTYRGLDFANSEILTPGGSSQLAEHYANLQSGIVQANDDAFFGKGNKDSIFYRELDKTVEDEDGEETTEKVDVWANDNFPFVNQNIAYLMNPDGATAGGIKLAQNILIEEYTYYRLSVWVKTSEPKTGGINLHLINNSEDIPENNAAKMYSVSGIVTDVISLDDRESTTSRHDKYADWVEYSFYISGGQLGGSTFDLELWMGNRITAATDTVGSLVNKDNFVLAANLCITEITNSNYSSASGTNATTGIVASIAATPNLSNGNFDDSVASQATRYDDLTDPSNWTELVGHDKGEDQIPVYAPSTVNDYRAGIFNRNHAENGNYAGKDFFQTFQTILGGQSYADFFNFDGTSSGNTNMLMIYNKTATAIGFRSGSGSVAANSFAEVRVWVRSELTSGNANIYLTTNGKIITPEGWIATYEDEDEETVQYLTEHKGNALTMQVANTAGWQCYKFYIASGDTAVSYNIELWAGSSDGKELAQGMVFFDSISAAGIVEAAYDLIVEGVDDITVGKVVLPDGSYAMFGDYSKYYTAPGTDDDSTTDEPDDEEEPNDTGCGTIGWEGITTIAILAAVLIALIAVLIRKISSSKRFKKKEQIEERKYDRDNVDKD